MKTLTLIIVSLMAGVAFAQTKIDKTVPVAAGQKIRMRFDYPELVKVSTWEKNEISIQGVVSLATVVNSPSQENIAPPDRTSGRPALSKATDRFLSSSRVLSPAMSALRSASGAVARSPAFAALAGPGRGSVADSAAAMAG